MSDLPAEKTQATELIEAKEHEIILIKLTLKKETDIYMTLFS